MGQPVSQSMVKSVVKEMAMTREEFLRMLPHAMAGQAYTLNGASGGTVADAERVIEIVVQERSPRRIGSLTLPVTSIELTLCGYGEAEAAEALRRFDLAYQRGGG